MQREESFAQNKDDGEDVYSFASVSDNPVLQKYAVALRDAEVTMCSFDRPTIVTELIACGIPPIAAGDIVDAVRAYRRRGSVGVYWDIENIPLPPDVDPLKALNALRNKILERLGDIVEFKAYMDMELFVQKYSAATRGAFLDSRIQLIDAPHNFRKEVADKSIIVDAMMFVHRTPVNPVVCLITADSDFSPMLSHFRMSGVRTMVITHKGHVRSLRQQTPLVLVWPHHFFEYTGSVENVAQRNRPLNTYNNNNNNNKNSSNTEGTINKTSYRSSGSPPSYGATSVSPGAKRTTKGKATPAATVANTSTTSADSPPNKPSTVEPATVPPVVPLSASDVQPEIELEALHPHSTPFVEDEDEAIEDPVVRDLVECIREVQKETGAKKVRRFAVGVRYKKLTLEVTSMRDAMALAVDKGVVVIGGRLGHAWIALASDGVSDDNPEATLPVSAEPSEDGTANVANNEWYLSLRFNRYYRNYQDLNAFAPAAGEPNLEVRRELEPNGFWTRMAIGPFPSVQAADDYFQTNFGSMQLLYKVTNNISLYYGSAASGKGQHKKQS